MTADAEPAAGRRSVPPEVLEAAMALVNTLAGNAAFRAQIADEEIARRVDEGELVPVERLSIAPGLELVPAGRLDALDRAARAVVRAWADISGEQGWTDEEVVLSHACKGLAALYDLDQLDDDVPRRRSRRRGRRRPALAADRDSGPSDEEEKPGKTQVDDVDPTDASTSEPTDEDEDHEPPLAADREPDEPETSDASGSATLPEGGETGTPGMPLGMPTKDDRGPCEQCGAVIGEDDQAQLSWILRRKKLCRVCHTGGGGPEPTEEEPNGAPTEP